LLVASGLNTKWVKVQKAKNKGPTEVAQCMDDEAALSTRPDYPPLPTKFDREVADARLATAKAGTSRSKQKNTIHFFYHSTALSYTELDHRSLLLLSPSRKAVMIPIRILKIHLTLLISLVL